MVNRRVAVIGAGVAGMTTALNIMQTLPDIQVTVIADKFSPETTSDAAAGMVTPGIIGDNPPELIRKWARSTFDYFSSVVQSGDAGRVGAQWISGYILHTSTEPPEEPLWKDCVYGFRSATAEELSHYPGHTFGWFYTTLLVESRLLLPWIKERILSLGARIETRRITDLAELAEHFDIVVNCAGCGANNLVKDKSVTPTFGQIITVEAPWLKNFVGRFSGENMVHVIPGITAVYLGGTRIAGLASTEPLEQYKNHIWEKCVKLVPSLQGAKVLYNCSGLRPSRPVVRLDKENMEFNGKTVKVVHNYGHGNIGVTLSWGCAHDAAKLVKECIDEFNCNI